MADRKLESSESSPRSVQILQWAQHPGPVGGVTRCVEDLTAALRGSGYEVGYVDTGSPRGAARALKSVWRRRSLHLFHISRVWRAIILAPVFAILPGRTALVLHSGGVRRQLESHPAWMVRLLTLSLRGYNQIWAVNADVGSAMPQRLQRRVRIVSPFVSIPAAVFTDKSAPEARDPHLITVATNSNHPHYNAGTAVDAVRIVRGDWPDAKLWILAYDRDDEDMAALRTQIAGEEWVQLSFNLSGRQVAEALATSAVFLRPSSWDGDSVIVREALAAGARVVASDVCARPLGVELASLDPADIAAAIVGGGRPSSGAGLSSTSIVAAALCEVALLARRDG
jgi:glycosyltransferase involved in cell wall biosynthesis